MRTSRFLAVVLAAAMLLSICASAAYTGKVVVSSQRVTLNGSAVPVAGFNIDGSNYFKLRDIAYILSATKNTFSVVWDAAANRIAVQKGAAYTPAGGELSPVRSYKTVTHSAQQLTVDSKAAKVDAFNIDGSNYNKIRDLASVLGFTANWDAKQNAVVLTAEIPAYDLRDEGRVTLLEDQDVSYSCWAYAMDAAMESNMLTDGLSAYGLHADQLDLSEQQLVYFAYAGRSTKDTHLTAIVHDRGSYWNWGIGAVARGLGTALEADVPFDGTNYGDASVELGYEKLATARLYASGFVSENGIVRYDPETDTATLDHDELRAVKNAIMKYGALLSQMNDSAYYQSFDPAGTTYIYSCSDSDEWDHFVTVIGWDDSISADLFTGDDDGPAPGDGAWIVRSSSASSGADGYAYVSYYDSAIRGLCYLDVVPADTWDGTYAYDDLGWEDTAEVQDTSYANVFTAQRAEHLSHVSFYTLQRDASYTVSVYALKEGDTPAGGTLLATASGTFADRGYHTVALTSAVAMAKGQRFSVVVKATGGVGVEGPLGGAPEDEIVYRANAGESFVLSGGTWNDLTASNMGNACIKAHTAFDAPDTSKAWAALEEYEALYDGYGEWRLYRTADSLFNMLWDDPARADHPAVGTGNGYMQDWFGIDFGSYSSYTQAQLDNETARLLGLMERFAGEANVTETRYTVTEYAAHVLANGEAYDPGNKVTVTISSKEDLSAFIAMVNKGDADFYGVTVELTNDVDASSLTTSGIGNAYGVFFRGAFNGNGHTIKGLTVTGKALFPALPGGARVWNLTLENGVYTSFDAWDGEYYSDAAGIAGGNDGIVANCHLKNCICSFTPEGTEPVTGDLTTVVYNDQTVAAGHRGAGGYCCGCSVTTPEAGTVYLMPVGR